MKNKILMSSALLITLSTLTGCGLKEKTLTCTQTTSDNGFTNDDKIVYKFSDDKIKSAKQDSSITAEGDYVQYIEDYKKSAQEAVDGYNKIDGMSAKVESGNNKVSVIVEMNPSKMQESDFSLYSMGENYDSLKSKLTDQGYTCK